MRIEVIYALQRQQTRVVLDLPTGSTVQDAIEASGLLQGLPQLQPGCVGVWGRQVSAETRLRDRDRVEIYRPLIADPKQVRRERAAKARK
jgi:putative ubiquitin-RnfH superfamily antitoxin RatB of RatAB toxin-antitoxin module